VTINEIQDQIIGELSARDDLTDKYRYIVDLAKHLESPESNLRSEENRIKGCQSNVWIRIDYNDDKIYIWGDSDSLIMKGMLALLIRVFNNQSPQNIVNADLYFIYKTGLNVNLSPASADGLIAIINHIKKSVKEIAR